MAKLHHKKILCVSAMSSEALAVLCLYLNNKSIEDACLNNKKKCDKIG
jgi:hypothetical protein